VLGKELLAAPHYDQMTGFLLFSRKGSFLAMPRPRSTAEAPRGRLLLWTDGALSQEAHILP
jgi:hypothetical protein